MDYKLFEDFDASSWRSLESSSSSVLKTDQVVLNAVKQNWRALAFALPSQRNDKAIMLAAVTQEGSLLRYGSDNIRSDRDVVMAAVKHRGSSIKFANEIYLLDREVFLTAVKSDWSVLQLYACEEFRNDREIVFAAFEQRGCALRYASEILRSDKEVVLKAVQREGLAVQYASDDLKQDEDVVMACLKQNGLAIKHLPIEWQRNEQAAFHAVEHSDGCALEFLPLEVRLNRRLCTVAVTLYPYVISDVPDQVKEDVEFALELMSSSSEGKSKFKRHTMHLLHSFPQSIKQNRNVVLAAVKSDFMPLVCLDDCIDEIFKDDVEIISLAVQCDGDCLQFASKELRNDVELVLAAVNQNGLALRFAHEKLQNDRHIALAAVNQNGLALQYASNELRNDFDVVLAAVKQNGESIKFISKSPMYNERLTQNKDIVFVALQQTMAGLMIFDTFHYTHDKEFMLKLINLNWRYYHMANGDLIFDVDVLIEAASQSCFTFGHHLLEHRTTSFKKEVENRIALRFPTTMKCFQYAFLVPLLMDSSPSTPVPTVQTSSSSLSSCKLSLLKRLGKYGLVAVKRSIADYAGLQYGEEFSKCSRALRNLAKRLENDANGLQRTKGQALLELIDSRSTDVFHRTTVTVGDHLR
jgi:hypothetical protein